MQGRACGGRARGIPGLFVLTLHSPKVTLPTWPPPLHPRRKELTHRGKDHLPWGDPRPRLAAVGGPFHFLHASPLRTRETNVRRANQLQKHGPERSGTQTRDPSQPAAARPARAGRAPSPAAAPQAAALRLTPPGLPAPRQPPPDLGVPLTTLTGPPPPPRRGLTCCPPPCPRRSPVSPRSRAGGGGGGGGGAAPTRGGRSQGRSSPSANHSGLWGFTRPSGSRSSRAAQPRSPAPGMPAQPQCPRSGSERGRSQLGHSGQ